MPKEEEKKIEKPEEDPAAILRSSILDIVKNVKFSVQKIHIRFEDDYFDPLRPYSFGIILEKFMTFPSETEWSFNSLQDMKFKRTKPTDFIGLIFREISIQNFKVYWKSRSELIIPTSLWEETKTMKNHIFDALPMEELKSMMGSSFSRNNLLDPINIFISVVINTRESAYEEAQKQIRPRIKMDLLMTKINFNIFPSIIEDLITFQNLTKNMSIMNELKGYRPFRKPEWRNPNFRNLNRRRLIVRDWLFYTIWAIRIKNVYQEMQILKDKKYFELKNRLKLRRKYNIKTKLSQDKFTKINFGNIDIKLLSNKGIDPLEEYIRNFRQKKKQDLERAQVESENKLNIIWGLGASLKFQEIAINVYGEKYGKYQVGVNLFPGLQIVLENLCIDAKILQFHKEVIFLFNEFKMITFMKYLKEIGDFHLIESEIDKTAGKSIFSPNKSPGSNLGKRRNNTENPSQLRETVSHYQPKLQKRNEGVFDLIYDKMFGNMSEFRPKPVDSQDKIPEIEFRSGKDDEIRSVSQNINESIHNTYSNFLSRQQSIPNVELSFNPNLFFSFYSPAKLVENNTDNNVWMKCLLSLSSLNKIQPGLKIRAGYKFNPNVNQALSPNITYFVFAEIEQLNITLFPKAVEEICKMFVEYRELPMLRDALALGKIQKKERLPINFSAVPGNHSLDEIDNARIYLKDETKRQEEIPNEEKHINCFPESDEAKRREQETSVKALIGEPGLKGVRKLDKTLKKFNLNIKFKLGDICIRVYEQKMNSNELILKKVPFSCIKIPPIYGQIRKEKEITLFNFLGFTYMSSKPMVDLVGYFVDFKSIFSTKISNDFLNNYYQIYSKIQSSNLYSKLSHQKKIPEKSLSSINAGKAVQNNELKKDNDMTPKPDFSSKFEFQGIKAPNVNYQPSMNFLSDIDSKKEEFNNSVRQNLIGKIYQPEETKTKFIQKVKNDFTSGNNPISQIKHKDKK